MVMFFRMTNLPTTFQGMINEILKDMINEEKVMVFMDNMLVGTKMDVMTNKLRQPSYYTQCYERTKRTQ